MTAREVLLEDMDALQVGRGHFNDTAMYTVRLTEHFVRFTGPAASRPTLGTYTFCL